MPSPECEKAISEAIRVGNAILKFISPNDVGLTGGHQYGYYLPKPVWQMFSPHPPVRGVNSETFVTVTWQDGRVTNSRVTWYGKGTRSEYRLTRFGRDFPFRTADNVGDLLVLVPENLQRFSAFVLDHDSDIEDIEAALGLRLTDEWAAYRQGEPHVETEEECVDKRFRLFVQGLDAFPAGSIFSDQTRNALLACILGFDRLVPDEALIRSMESEYALFRLAERQICQREIVRLFKDVDDFLKTASSIMNRRKARAGRSLENHMEYVLKGAGIPHKMRPRIDGDPDIIIPSVEAYRDASYPVEKLIMVGVKTTCKDRWRQVISEAKRIPVKHILTIQQGISSKQLELMYRANVKLIVPEKLHKQYPAGTPITMFSVTDFVNHVKGRLA
jgi:type II restriction enzyme